MSEKAFSLKKIFFYAGVITGFTLFILFTLNRGEALEAGRHVFIPAQDQNSWRQFVDSLVGNFKHPLAILLAQIVTIILVARLFGFIFNKVGQPAVIGEIIAGIALGPSLLGSFLPEVSVALFPEASLGNLQFLSQVGLILFMFVVGMELDLKVLQNQAHDAVVVSHASIIIPFALGTGLAYFIYESFAPEGVLFSSFALFMGIAMSITAFPVLARIVQERNIHKTKIGAMVITCAAADDITAWCLLAAVIAIVKAGSFFSSLYIMALAIVYVFLMLKLVKPFLQRIGELHTSRENLSKPIVAIFFIVLILSSYATEVIGIHALFGAFMTGVIIPENAKFRSIFIEKVEDVALVLLLPLFFVFTGLRTEIGLINDPHLWIITAIIILVAVTGKFLGSAIAARFVGQNWKDSLTIGALMNTRGLMELVVLNIGYDLGVLTPQVFAMMVVMALVTTFMTGPALDLINRGFREPASAITEEQTGVQPYRILISFGNPQSGRNLLRFAAALTRETENVTLTVMHLSPGNELHAYNREEYEQESFAPVIEESKNIKQKIATLFKSTRDLEHDIAEVANAGEYDLLLIGVGQSIYQGSLLGKILGFTTGIINPERIFHRSGRRERLFDYSALDERTRNIVALTDTNVGILVGKTIAGVNQIVIPYTASDPALILFVHRLIKNSLSNITFLDIEDTKTGRTDSAWKELTELHPGRIDVLNAGEVADLTGLLSQQDLMLVNLDLWELLVRRRTSWLTAIGSTLILVHKVSQTED